MTKSKKNKPLDPAADSKILFELSEHVADLIDASLNSRYSEVRRIGSHLTKDFLELGLENQAKKISSLLRKKGVPLQASGQLEMLPVDMKSKLPLIEELPWPTNPLFLNEDASVTFSRLIEDSQHSSKLSKMGLSSRLCLLLMGPPGTGKTLLAGHIAAKLERPFYVARLDSLISSLLGETAKNIRSIFDFIPHKNAVLLLDEIDAIAKLRDDRHELGEIKRVVNTLIQGLDSLDDQTVVIGATNHSHLLDPAIWRRFPYKIEFKNPDPSVREEMWKHFLFQDKDAEKDSKALAVLSDGFSGAEIQEISLRARRQAILGKKELNVEEVGTLILKHLQGQTLQGSVSLNPEDQRKYLAYFMCVEKGLTQIEAAKFLGVTRQTIAHYLKELSDGETNQ
jgi:SpoVK/Ycf46/Vps4 family AAA+-type ATPase